MIKDIETVVTTVKDYQKLSKAYMKLKALEKAGVDNWEGYDIAMDYLEEMENEEN